MGWESQPVSTATLSEQWPRGQYKPKWARTPRGRRRQQIRLDGGLRVCPTHEDWCGGWRFDNAPVEHPGDAVPLGATPPERYPSAEETRALAEAHLDGMPGAREELIAGLMAVVNKTVSHRLEEMDRDLKEVGYAKVVAIVDQLKALDIKVPLTTYVASAVRNAIGKANRTESLRGLTDVPKGVSPSVSVMPDPDPMAPTLCEASDDEWKPSGHFMGRTGKHDEDAWMRRLAETAEALASLPARHQRVLKARSEGMSDRAIEAQFGIDRRKIKKIYLDAQSALATKLGRKI